MYLFHDLQVFYYTILRIEGTRRKDYYGSIWEALSILEALLEKIEKEREAK